MTSTTAEAFPAIDAIRQHEISDEQAQFFRDNGVLLIRNALAPEETKALQDATWPLYQRAVNEKPKDPDYAYAKHELTGEPTPYRIEYVIEKDKTDACKRLLAHPFILRSIEKLQGPNFIPTWDSMVFKTEGMGKAIPWHRDAAPYDAPGVDGATAAINVDFYLDGSDLTNCLWAIPGSNRWPADQAQATIPRLNDAPGMFSRDEYCVPLPVRPGDVLFHNVLVLHGSPAARSKVRRVVYYEFRPADIERQFGPHTPDYIPLKQQVLIAAMKARAEAPLSRDERPFSYRPTGQFIPAPDAPPPRTFRYAHGDFWRR